MQESVIIDGTLSIYSTMTFNRLTFLSIIIVYTRTTVHSKSANGGDFSKKRR